MKAPSNPRARARATPKMSQFVVLALPGDQLKGSPAKAGTTNIFIISGRSNASLKLVIDGQGMTGPASSSRLLSIDFLDQIVYVSLNAFDYDYEREHDYEQGAGVSNAHERPSESIRWTTSVLVCIIRP